jgi:hypothetical protein
VYSRCADNDGQQLRSTQRSAFTLGDRRRWLPRDLECPRIVWSASSQHRRSDLHLQNNKLVSLPESFGGLYQLAIGGKVDMVRHRVTPPLRESSSQG